MRLALMVSFITATLMVAMSHAAPADDTVIKLHAEGFKDIEVSRTLLGRMRITATKDGTEREIIMQPRSGLILRDYTSAVTKGNALGSDKGTEKSSDAQNNGGGNGNGNGGGNGNGNGNGNAGGNNGGNGNSGN